MRGSSKTNLSTLTSWWMKSRLCLGVGHLVGSGLLLVSSMNGVGILGIACLGEVVWRFAVRGF